VSRRRGLEALDAAALAEGMARLVEPVARPPGGLDALLVAVANPWRRFVEALAELADLPVESAGRVLDRAEAGRGWTPGLMSGMRLWHIDGGPATAGADVGLVQLAPGAVHPLHDHLGPEIGFVLAGEYVDSAGHTLRAGDREERGPGQPHAFTAGPEGVTLALVLREGIAIHDPAGGPPIVYRG
jgi:quercetin dioxygenase-like cupin family protein